MMFLKLSTVAPVIISMGPILLGLLVATWLLSSRAWYCVPMM